MVQSLRHTSVRRLLFRNKI